MRESCPGAGWYHLTDRSQAVPGAPSGVGHSSQGECHGAQGGANAGSLHRPSAGAAAVMISPGVHVREIPGILPEEPGGIPPSLAALAVKVALRTQSAVRGCSDRDAG